MAFKLRFRLREGQSWREYHKLIQVEQRPSLPTTGLENAWTLEQTVLETLPDRSRVAWRRRDENPEEQTIGTAESSHGELWIDELGRSLPIGFANAAWSEPLFPEKEIEVAEIWTNSAVGEVPVYFTLEKAEKDALYLVSYMQTEQSGARHEVRGSTRLCPESGRVLSSTTVTKVVFPDNRTEQTVIEVTSEELA